MKRHQQPRLRWLRWTIATGTVSFFTLLCFGNSMMPAPLWASAIAAPMGAVAFTPPPPPPDRDAPGNRGGGAGRGCGMGSQPLIALMPEYQQTLAQDKTITKVWGATLAERPTFWFDVPYEKGAIAAMEFVLQDNASPAKELYRSAIVPPDTSGIISIPLPATVPPLETGKLYEWFFKVRLQCPPGDPAAKPTIKEEQLNGWVQHLSPDAALTSQLKQASPQQRAALYTQNGIWFDALTTVGHLRLNSPQDPRAIADWNGLLKSVGLEKLTTKPLVPCCKPKS